MKQDVSVPGEVIPATPRFVCAIPDDWQVGEAPGAHASFAPSAPTGVSVVVSSSRVSKEIDLRDVAVRSFARQRQAHRAVTIDSQRVGRFGDLVVYVRGVTVTDDATFAQVQALFFAPTVDDRSTADVFSFVGSCPAEVIETFGPSFIDILASITFDEQSLEAPR